MQLFRQQALDAQRYRLYGEVLLKPRFSHTACAAFLMVWFGTALLWLAKGSYANRETVQGWLEPVTGYVEVTAPADASIEEVLVREGESVRAGQALLVLRRSRTLTSGMALSDSLLEQYRRQQEALITRHHSVDRQTQQLLHRTREKLQQAGLELEYLDEQIRAAAAETALLTARRQQIGQLADSGHLPRYSADDSLLRHLASSRDLAELRQRRESLISRIADLQSELAMIPQRKKDESAAIEIELSELTQAISRIEGNGRFTVTASRNGTVQNLQARPGQRVAQVSGPLMNISGHGNLQAQILIPVRGAGFLRQGQEIIIQYHAFPHQKFGSYSGEIIQLSRQAVLPGHIDNNPLQISEPVYKLTVRLYKQHVNAEGSTLPLLQGMTLNAVVVLSERTLLEWLLSPIYALRGRL